MSQTDNQKYPLDDVTVIDLTQVIAGPFATMMLGDMGANVVKIEAPDRGDLSRQWQPRPEYFDTLNRNKRSISIDLSQKEGQKVVQSLLKDADVFLENMKPGGMTKFGLSYEKVKQINPNIIYCSISGFGTNSPYEELPAWDIIIQAMSGVMGITGEKDSNPVWSGLPIGDLAAGLYAVNSILVSLYAKQEDKISSEHIEVPMMDSMVSLLTARAGHTFGTGESFPRAGTRHPTSSPFGVYDTSDGKIVVAAGTDGLWSDFCRSIDRLDLVNDERFNTQDKRLENREKLMPEIEATLDEQSTADWLEIMHHESVPAAPINDSKTVWDDPHVKQRNLHRTMNRDKEKDADVIASPIQFETISERMELSPPDLGEHTDEVLQELGLEIKEIQQLRQKDIIE